VQPVGEVDRIWKVGELARATGLTTRALHHYDDIELLVPARAESGHRVYSGDDVERLYRVLALRGVGLSLDEIGAVLDDDGVGLIDTMRRHVAAVERDIEQRHRLLHRLRDMLDGLERSSAPTVDELIGAVEAMTVVEATIEDVVTRERWDAAWELTAQHVVLLRERDGDRLLPIWIGEPEAAALVMHRRGARTPRPLGHDLMAGLRCGAPILVSSDVIDAASLGAWPRAEPVPDGGSEPPPWTPADQPHGPAPPRGIPPTPSARTRRWCCGSPQRRRASSVTASSARRTCCSASSPTRTCPPHMFCGATGSRSRRPAKRSRPSTRAHRTRSRLRPRCRWPRAQR